VTIKPLDAICISRLSQLRKRTVVVYEPQVLVDEDAVLGTLSDELERRPRVE
jgi:hypothetical protein